MYSICYDFVDWIHLAQDRDPWRSHVNIPELPSVTVHSLRANGRDTIVHTLILCLFLTAHALVVCSELLNAVRGGELFELPEKRVLLHKVR